MNVVQLCIIGNILSILLMTIAVVFYIYKVVRSIKNFISDPKNHTCEYVTSEDPHDCDCSLDGMLDAFVECFEPLQDD